MRIPTLTAARNLGWKRSLLSTTASLGRSSSSINNPRRLASWSHKPQHSLATVASRFATGSPLAQNRSCSPSSPQVPSSLQLLSCNRLFSSSTTSTPAEESKYEDASSKNATIDASPSSYEFQAETRQLLDIVTHSLYTDKEVFLRELVSNASDALEKLRHMQTVGMKELAPSLNNNNLPLEIRIDLDEVASSITITDTGVGMTQEEMIRNLGTIARSGSKNFLQELAASQAAAAGGGEKEEAPKPISMEDLTGRGIIGKFGVGFYSAFMVADKVQVRSRSALAEDCENARVWTSDGTGTYDIAPLDPGVRQDRGSSVVIYLKEEHWDYCSESKIEKILKRYSNFVNFPIYLNGKRVNTMEAIWSKDPKEVTEEEHTAFYKYLANMVDEPVITYHFRADAPLDVKALFYVPSFHSEKFGMSRMEPGVALYSRKVLIESKSPDILPDWLRFIKGIVDSEDLPLSISREKAQDSALIQKLRRTLTRKFISHLAKMLKDDKASYLADFYKEYSFFLKEGICQDYEFQAALSKLLFFETSKNSERDLVSLDEYVARMRPEQKDIYYLTAPTRNAAVNSPYLEAFEKAGVEVLFLFTAIDDFVMANLEQYEGRKLVSVEKGDIDLSDLSKDEKKKTDTDKKDQDATDDDDDDEKSKLYKADRELSKAEALDFCMWFKKQLGEKRIASCVTTSRLTSSPAIVTDNESGAMRRMMRLVDTSDGSRDAVPLPKQHVEINPKHSIIVGIFDLKDKEPMLAKVLAEQVFDNCLVAAGLLDDSRSMLPRLNDILVCVVKGANENWKSADGAANSSSENSPSDQKDTASNNKKEEVSKKANLNLK